MASVMTGSLGSEAFEDGGDAHATADTQGGQAVALLAHFQFVEQGAEDRAARGAERVAHGNGAAVDVDPRSVDAHVFDELEDDRGKRLVDFEQVDRKSVV